LPAERSTPPEFIIYVRDPKKCDDEYFDTSSLQLKDFQTQRPVMFQVASNFNCQENSTPLINFKTSDYLTHMMSDSTQGPSASAGAGVGAIARLMVHLSTPINLLSDTVYGSQVMEGKLYAPDKLILPIEMDRIKIGLHTNVSANFDRSSFDGKCRYHEQGKVIDQVFTSTLIYPNVGHQKLTYSILSASYMGTYLASIHRKTEVLVLTLIGDGAFRNPYETIIDAMIDAHLQVGHKGCLKQVILPLYNNQHSPDLLQRSLIARGYPPHLIKVIQH
jgi:hypothetical protein